MKELHEMFKDKFETMSETFTDLELSDDDEEDQLVYSSNWKAEMKKAFETTEVIDDPTFEEMPVFEFTNKELDIECMCEADFVSYDSDDEIVDI